MYKLVRMAVKKASRCVYQVHYHLVFPVKYRKALLMPKVEKAIVEISEEISERYEIEFEKIGCDLNHIHILCSFHPKYSIGETIRKFKSITARELFKRFSELKRALWGGEFWSDGYYAATIGEGGNWDVVKKYVEDQGKSSEMEQLRLF